jgi:hypothetical protein
MSDNLALVSALAESAANDVVRRALMDLEARIAALEGMQFGRSVRGGEDEFPPPAGFRVRGTKQLYLPPILREYDADNNLIAVGSETGGEGRKLLPTWDYLRWT